MSPSLNIALGLRDDFTEEVILEEWLCQTDEGSERILVAEKTHIYGESLAPLSTLSGALSYSPL